MDVRKQAVDEVVRKLLSTDAELLNADVSVLSDLNDDGFVLFIQAWEKAGAERRFQLISKMVQLSEEDFILDFTRIFKMGINDLEEEIRIKSLDGLALEDKYIYARPIIGILRTDESPKVRSAAAEALGKFALMAECGDMPEAIGQEVIAILIETLQNIREPLSVRRHALESIACCNQELIEHYIEEYYYSDDPGVKASAIFSMGLNCNSRWSRYLIDEMQSETAEFRYEAARAAGEIGDEEAIPHLLKLVDDNDAQVQESAISSLGKIGGAEAKRALQKLCKTADARIKAAANAALTELLACENPLSLN